MFFLKISNVDMLFDEKTLIWKYYTTNKALLTIKQVQFIDSKKFVIATLDTNSETFRVHVAIRKQEKMPIHSEKLA